MADIELVIKIPEEEYRWIIKSDETVFADVASKECMLHAIKNGTPLPKGHGDLIDADETIANLQKQCDEVFKLGKVKPEDYYIAKDAKFMQDTWKTWCVDFNKWLTNRPVVIPADKDGD